MSERILDHRRLAYDQSARIGTTTVVAMALQNFSEVAYQAACGETEFHLASGGWVMDIITQPSLTVKVQTAEPKLRTALLGVLRTLGFRVKEKDDHLVVSLT